MDSSQIPMMYQGMQLNDPLEQRGKAMALSHMAAQGRYLDSQVADKEHANNLAAMQQQALASAGGDTGQAISNLRNMGLHSAANEIEKHQYDMQKTQADIRGKQAETSDKMSQFRSQAAIIGFTGGTMQHADLAAKILEQGGDTEGANYIRGLMQEHPDATPDQIRSVFKPFVSSQLKADDLLMPKFQDAGGQLVNVNPNFQTDSIAKTVSPNTVYSEDRQDKRSQQSSASNPFYQFLPTAEGYRVGNARTGAITVPGQQFIPATADPNLQGAIAGAKHKGEMQSKRDFNMSGITDIIGEARRTLTGVDAQGNKAPLPTGSGVGTAADFAGAMVGMSPKGAAEADTMKTIAGALTSKMPRMEGPQSDKDTLQYKEMAAQLGDSKIPVSRRLKALQEVERLWVKYDKSAKQQQQPSGGVKFLGFE